jgi:hypothetical protein
MSVKRPPAKRPSRAVTTITKSGNPNYLRYLREAADVSLRDLGAAAGVSPTYVLYLEKGVKPLSMERLESFESAIARLRAAREEK